MGAGAAFPLAAGPLSGRFPTLLECGWDSRILASFGPVTTASEQISAQLPRRGQCSKSDRARQESAPLAAFDRLGVEPLREAEGAPPGQESARCGCARPVVRSGRTAFRPSPTFTP